MEQNVWLGKILETIQADVTEIKTDAKVFQNEVRHDIRALQKSKFMFDGAKEFGRLVITIGVTLFTVWITRR